MNAEGQSISLPSKRKNMIPNYTSLENLCKWPNKNSKNKKKKGVPARIIFFFFLGKTEV
jgi:hypothetical protein